MDYLNLVSVGTTVVLRTYTSGVVVGKIVRGFGGCAALTDWRHLRSWSGVGGEGSVYDLIQSNVVPQSRGPMMSQLGIFQQADVVVVDQATYDRLAK